MLTVGGLFSGIGGIELGLERAGMQILWHAESDPFCQHILGERWPGVPCYPDVRELRAGGLEPIDVLCGGFPCQDISLAGTGAGITGSRSGLWVEFARLIGELRPRYVIVENVAALLARGLNVVLSDLAALGFDAEWDCVPASAVGAPHRRDRVWIVAYPGRGDVRTGSRPGEVRGAEGEAEGEGDQRQRGRHAVGDCGTAAAVADAAHVGHERFGPARDGRPGLEDGCCRNESDWWAIEPDVRLLVDGLSQGVGLNGHAVDADEAGSEVARLLLRVLRDSGEVERSSHGRRSDEQLAGELADALRVMSHALALGEREAALAVAFAFVRRLRTACEAIGAVRDASESLAPAWLSLSPEDQAWVALAVDGGRWASEWPGVGRVARGVPDRVARLRALGNAVVPEIPEWIGRRIVAWEAEQLTGAREDVMR